MKFNKAEYTKTLKSLIKKFKEQIADADETAGNNVNHWKKRIKELNQELKAL